MMEIMILGMEMVVIVISKLVNFINYKNSLIKIINDKMSIYKKTYKQQNYCKENIS
jgi:Na+-transporting methylmalonyl-CoA/oxaloacetate decarboxylase gamma subunit